MEALTEVHYSTAAQSQSQSLKGVVLALLYVYYMVL